jgi:hypothetical protein
VAKGNSFQKEITPGKQNGFLNFEILISVQDYPVAQIY